MIGAGLMVIVGFVHQIPRVIVNPFSHPYWKDLFPSSVPIDKALLIFASCLATGFHEELVCRGYLIPRFETLLGSTWKSILFSSIVFGTLHVHKGMEGVITSGLSGVIWGIGFSATRRIWPVVISHALWDYVVATHLYHLLPP